MSVTQFELASNWRIAAPLPRVWPEIVDVDAWPSWWRAVRKVERLRDGDAEGIGALRRLTWATALPYTITFDVMSTRIEPMHLIEGRASGELSGVGLWTLASDGAGTTVRYDWRVELGKPWMRTLAPLLRPAFAWNHNVLMRRGEEDLRRRLGINSS
jgi:hypothetical protein